MPQLVITNSFCYNLAMDIAKFKEDIVFWTELRGARYCFHSTWGLFSPENIDEGTRLLIDNMEIDPSDLVLDLGCGYGALGVVAGTLAPQGHIHMVDKDFVAVKYAQENAELNHLKNTESYLSNGFSNIDEKRTFHKILSNLPAKVGKEMLSIFLTDARKHLKPNGKIYVVTVLGLKNFIKQYFEEEFGNYEKVVASKNYIVASATKVI